MFCLPKTAWPPTWKSQELIPRLMFNERGERQVVPVAMPVSNVSTNNASKLELSLSAINVEQKKVLLELLGGDQHQQEIGASLIVEVSTKPLMMVLWTGVVLIIGGSVIAFKRRATVG